ncbi:CDP-alcohol phosphatidyltransferase family protein [Halovenus sp. WSH3]|uniref:CDP-alcohol phosphatidyltransferase family protein n=1 Tax=Halovenus carboxidivorans TaxID=2692199 RepID=A0A6B0TB44_9EURY|nr:CDP-alcohol phosphatidyltransferase family protein [Halovenus carboxidivorans]MXR52843.1 CDP-alcohol phosphatidyltransferase family protein [Halovenus carboxidivorans]
MTLDGLRPLADRMMSPLVSGAKRAGLTPNGISILALLAALAAAGSFYAASEMRLFYLAGAVFVLVNGVLDLVDGNLARELGTDSRAGDLLDHVLDRYADIIIISGLAAGLGEYALGLAAVTGVLMTSYLGTQAQAVDLDRVYGGILGRADRLALTGVVSAVTALVDISIGGLTPVAWLLVVFAVVGHITALQRFYYAMQALGE